jgi:hypothetical protein
MRIAPLIFTGSIAALAVLTAPALARNSNTNSNTQEINAPSAAPASSSCHAYQQGPDGSWTPLPCQELGTTSQARAQHESASRKAEDDAR